MLANRCYAFILKRFFPSKLKPEQIKTAITSVTFQGEFLIVDLADGRSVHAPISQFKKLINVPEYRRKEWRLIEERRCIYWQNLNIRISMDELLAH